MADMEFQGLLVDIADHLDSNTVAIIAFLCNLRTESRTALGVLQELQERGHFSSENVIEILKDCSKHDLAVYVEQNYRIKLGEQTTGDKIVRCLTVMCYSNRGSKA